MSQWGVSYWMIRGLTLGIILFSVGCLQDEGSKDSASNLPQSDLSVPPFVPPPPAPAPQPTPPPVGDPFIDIPFEVVGNTRTNAETITVRTINYDWVKMKVGWSEDCSDGVWANITPERTVNIPKKNAKQTMSIQVSDYDYIYERCFKVEIIQDNAGPEIIFKHYPDPTLAEGATPYVEYTVTDLSPIVETTCALNGIVKPCASGGPNIVNFTAMPEGNYQFTITAKDDFGYSSTSTVNWTVVSTTRNVTQRFNMNDYRKVDVLMIIDNSGSMEYEQKSMAERTGSLLSVLSGLDWQIGITTTDPRNVTLGDGRLIQLKNSPGQYILNSSMDPVVAQQKLSQTLQRTEVGSGSEQGIYATYRAIERSLDAANNPYHRQLIRDNAHFAAVIISDEDESANGAKNDPHNLLNLINASFSGQKNFSFHSIITKPGDDGCRNTYGAAFGDRLSQLSSLTGGIVGSVCESDYTPQVVGIANGIRNLLKTMTLSCAPIAGSSITVTLDGVAYNQPYVIEGVNMRFANELPPGQFEVNFRCLK